MAVAFFILSVNSQAEKAKYNFTGVYLVFKEKLSVKIGGYYEKTT